MTGRRLCLPGPFTGPRLQTDIASARWSSSTMSATIPGAVEIITLPNKAAMKRTTSRVARFLASAQGMIKTVKMNKQAMQTGFRPYNSLNGAINMDPTARPMRYKVNPNVTMVVEVPNSAAICDSPEVYDVEYNTLEGISVVIA